MSMSQQWERQIKGMQFPEIDVHHQVMGCLNTSPRFSRKVKQKWIISVAVLLFLFGTGFASANFIQLRFEDGSLALSIKSLDDDHSSIYPEEMTDSYRQLLEPGEAMGLYNPNGNPQQIVTSFERPLETLNYGELRERVEPFVALPAQISAPFVFQKAVIHHVIENVDVQQFISQSEAEGGKIVARKLNVTDEIHGVTLQFLAGEDSYSAAMLDGKSWSNIYTDLSKLKRTQVIPVMGSEGLLAYKDDMVIFMWRTTLGSQDLYYEIKTNESADEAETVILELLNILAPIQ